jgi:hypothetical protein
VGCWQPVSRSTARRAVPCPRRVDGERRRQHQHQTPTQKDLSQRPPRGIEPTANDTSAPAESVRLTDNPARGRGRAYLVEREMELDGNAALWALIDDYIAQSEVLNAIPMACSPLD